MCKCVTGCQGSVLISFEVKNEKDFHFTAPPSFCIQNVAVNSNKKKIIKKKYIPLNSVFQNLLYYDTLDLVVKLIIFKFLMIEKYIKENHYH